MTRMWIANTSIVLCILILRTHAMPLQKNTGGDQDSDEIDSDEEETNQRPTASQTQNVTDQELTNKATQFLSQYFSSYGTEIPLHIPTNLNHTIVITVVPNNASLTNAQNGYFPSPPEAPPSFVGDIPLFSSQQQQQQLISQNTQLSFEQQKETVATGTSEGNGNLTPVNNLFGFVPANRPPPIITREDMKTPKVITSTAPSTPTTSTTTTTPEPIREMPVDNIEDAILEAISIAEDGQGQSTTAKVYVVNPVQSTNSFSEANQNFQSSHSFSQSNQNFQALIQSGVIPGLSNANTGVIKVPSNFGTLVLDAEGQPAQATSAAISINTNTPAPPPTPVQAAPPSIPQIVFLPPIASQSTDNNAINSNTERRPDPTINAVSSIIGSISEGNLGGLVQNTIKLAETPVVQNTAKLATVAVLHNLFQGLNPCNFLGNCRQAPLG